MTNPTMPKLPLCGCGGSPEHMRDPKRGKYAERLFMACDRCGMRTMFCHTLDQAEIAWTRALSASQQAIPREINERALTAACMTEARDFAASKGYSLEDTMQFMNERWERWRHEITRILRSYLDAAPSSEPSQPVLGSEGALEAARRALLAHNCPCHACTEARAALPSQAPNHE